jgi:hypothetical protein
MKKTIKAGFLFVTLFLLIVSATKVHAQSTTPAKPGYKDFIADNPDAEADMKVVADFVNALTSADTDKAKSLLANGYLGYGPAPTDSSTARETITAWQENYKTQTGRKISFVSETFRVLQGDLKGDWVSLWGDYSFTQDGKSITFPLQYTARVSGGKITTDRVYYDRLFILQSLGYTVTPPDKGKK